MEAASISNLLALERFVGDNDDLLELEQRIGRFNIFDALGVARTEIRHSNFLAWLLDPNESHGQGSLFLKAILMDLLQKSPHHLRPFSPIQLDRADFRGVTIQREFRNIDLLIRCEEPSFVIAVENKVDSFEHSEQLQKYKQTVKELFPQTRSQFVFLTRGGDEPSDDDWTIYTYRDIHHILSRVRKTNAENIGDDVLTFLDHYLSLIGSRFMDDPKIEDLCRTIYKNHRQAIELIIERGRSVRTWPLEVCDEIFASMEGAVVLSPLPLARGYCPRILFDCLPPIGKGGRGRDPRTWMAIWFGIYDETKIRLSLWLDETSDNELRAKVIERLIQNPSEFGLQVPEKAKMPFRNAPIHREHVVEFDEGDPDRNGLSLRLKEALERMESALEKVPEVLRPIIDQWKAAQ